MSAPEDEATAAEDEAAHATALLEACPALSQRAYATTRRDYRERFDSGGGGPLPLFPPMMVEMEQQPSRKRALPPSCKTPFLCTAAGCLPRGVPDDVDDLLSAYLVSGVSRPNLLQAPRLSVSVSLSLSLRLSRSRSRCLTQVSPAPAPTSTWRVRASSARPTARRAASWPRRLSRASPTGSPATCRSTTRPGGLQAGLILTLALTLALTPGLKLQPWP